MISIRVLVVEDEELIRDSLADVLEGGGYEPVLAATGEDAVALLEEERREISALITDVNLSRRGVSGWDVARRARELSPAMPVLYITGGNAHESATMGVPNSVVLNKPFADSQLTTAISQLLNASSAPPAALP